MHIRILAVGRRMPAWVDAGFREYAGRMPGHCGLELIEIPPGRRSRSRDATRARAEEGTKMLAALGEQDRVVALEVGGRALDTPALAATLAGWMQGRRDVALLVGGPDGLDPACLARADLQWSLSPLTLPHGLVRVVLAEALYRAWSLHSNHPYHRA